MKSTSFTMASKVTLLLIASAFLFCSCGGNDANTNHSENSPAETTTADENTTATEKPEPANEAPQPESMTTLKENEKVYAWVDRLNIRDAANLKGKRVASVTEQEALEFTGKKSDNVETIVLRGVAYVEPWLDVKTKDGTEGWVFGGAVKREGETKGNGPISDDSFFYPHFGRFDLSTWKKGSSADGGGGDAESNTTAYTKNGRTLEITKTDVGEYGYHREYKLTDANGKVLKTRKFSFDVVSPDMELTEVVNVYTFNPPTKYTRTQKLDKHFMQLNARPVMVNGAWTEGPADPAPEPATDTNSATIGTISGSCSNLDKDSGCSCDFKADNDYVFQSDMGKNACVSLNGGNLALKYVRSDYAADLKKLSSSKYWITLQKRGPMLYFGKPLEEYGYAKDYEDEMEFLVDVMLSMDKIPSEIPILNKSEGMAIREVRDVANDAIALAKKRKQEKKTTISSFDHYTNDQYDVYTRTKNMTNYEGEADTYEGFMMVKSKSGKLLSSKKIKGTCGC